MTTAVTTSHSPAQMEVLERVLVQGDLKELTPEERVFYYRSVCESVGLNPLTRPFEYIVLNGKLTLYAKRDCTDQLRNIHGVSISILARELVDDIYVVTARATKPDGRSDESLGAVPIAGVKGEAKANLIMKAETKSKRRVTLSICGLGMLDESEIDTVPGSREAQQKVAESKIAMLQAEADPEPLISDEQRKRLYTIATHRKVAKPAVMEVLAKYRYTSSTEIKANDYDAIVRDIEALPATVEVKPSGKRKPETHPQEGRDIKAAREEIRGFEDAIGHDAFWRVLGLEGVSDVNDITDIKDALRIVGVLKLEAAVVGV
jgi:hypothetical protein